LPLAGILQKFPVSQASVLDTVQRSRPGRKQASSTEYFDVNISYL